MTDGRLDSRKRYGPWLGMWLAALLALPGCALLDSGGSPDTRSESKTTYRSSKGDTKATLPSLRVRGHGIKIPPPKIIQGKELTAYRLRPLDPIVINLRAIPVPQQIEDVIDENGNINLPYIGQVQAEGRTSAELEQNIQKLYVEKQIYRQVAVNIVIPGQSYFVRGEVRQPGRYQLASGVTLVQAIAAAGGYTEFANPKKTKMIRGGETFVYDLKEMERDPGKDLDIESGDVIVVPRSLL